MPDNRLSGCFAYNSLCRFRFYRAVLFAQIVILAIKTLPSVRAE